jgi:hypothetical protein
MQYKNMRQQKQTKFESSKPNLPAQQQLLDQVLQVQTVTKRNTASGCDRART